MISHKADICITSPPSKAQGTETLRAKGCVLGQNSVFWTWQDCCTYKLTVAFLACIRPTPDQASQHPSMDWGGARSPKAEELLTVTATRGGSQFLLGAGFLEGCPCSDQGAHVRVYRAALIGLSGL